jgi:hypothetical protein
MDNHCTCTNVNRCPYANELHNDRLVCQKPGKKEPVKFIIESDYLAGGKHCNIPSLSRYRGKPIKAAPEPTKQDLESFAQFFRIVKNYLRLRRLAE